MWKIIQPWLDPVIANKINFTKNNKDLVNFIEPDNLQKFYDGEDTWEYKYVEPVPGENEQMDSEEKIALQAKRDEIIRDYEKLTSEWMDLDPASDAGKEKADGRTALAKQLRENYLQLDPFIRTKTYYHRVGVIGPNGQYDLKAAK